MAGLLAWLFDSSGFVPRWRCGDWSGGLGWLHITSDLAIWLAYLAIPVVLLFFIRRRRDVPFRRVFWLFGLFILSCGTTHLLEAVIFYEPVYRLAGVAKVVTALASWGTVFALVLVVPRALAMRTPQELQRLVTARTAELAAVNATLRQEIAERIQVEAAGRASEERYHKLFESAPDGIVIADRESVYTDANSSICRMLGYTRDELVGRHASDIVAPTEVQHIGPALEAIKDETNYAREWQFRRKDGSVFRAEVLATVMPDGNLLGMIRDVTERNRAEESLREKERQLRATDRRLAELVEGMSEACFVLDAEWRFTFVNDRSETLFRRRRDDIIGGSGPIGGMANRVRFCGVLICAIRFWHSSRR